jgi:hypothetical protein
VRFNFRLWLVPVVVAGLLVVAALSWAAVVGTRETRIISPPGGSADPSSGPSDVVSYNADGGHPGDKSNPYVGGDRPARNVVFSQDGRNIALIAFSSQGRLVASDTDNNSDIYVMHRNLKAGTDKFGGKLQLVSGGGENIKPSLDGQTTGGGGFVSPHCVVWESLNGDTPTVMLRDLHKRAARVVARNGRDPVVDGECSLVSYESSGTIYVKSLGSGHVEKVAKGYNPDMETDGKGVAFDRPGNNGHEQVYYHALDKSGHEVGGDILVSDDAQTGGEGNDDSSDPNLNDNGAYVFFESNATDLCTNRCQGVSTDRNGHTTDVFRRTIKRTGPARDPHEMQMVSYDGTRDMQGDRVSDQVQTTGAGEQACFRSFSVNFRNLLFDANDKPEPYMHIYFWNFPRERRVGKISGESKPGPGGEFRRKDDTPAFNWSCGISNRGNFIGWTSDVEAMSGEQNGRQIPDAFIRFMGASDEGKKGSGNF